MVSQAERAMLDNIRDPAHSVLSIAHLEGWSRLKVVKKSSQKIFTQELLGKVASMFFSGSCKISFRFLTGFKQDLSRV